jgi:CRISPR/Cas system CMR subunit Cmr6 (Cas7 group RAMP superfamily)
MTEYRLKEIVPDIFRYTDDYGETYVDDIDDINKQTNDLRTAIECMIGVAEETGNRELVICLEQITGLPYSEIEGK